MNSGTEISMVFIFDEITAEIVADKISPKFVSIRKVELTRCVAGTESILKSSKFYW